MIEVKNREDRKIVERVYREGQGHIFRWWKELSEESRNRLLDQLRSIDFDLLNRLKKKCDEFKREEKRACEMEPVDVIRVPETEEERRREHEARTIGEKKICEGGVCAFLVAGGQATRLGFSGPKGCFPIGPVTGKSLFQIYAEKIMAASKRYNIQIPWYIMTSETNDRETREFFIKNNFFGFDREDIFFVKQRMIAAIDENGKLILDKKDHIFVSPNGHGGSLLALYENGALEDIKKRGIEIISYFQVDNVLINIIDPVFIGYHLMEKSEMSSKMVRKKSPYEKVGVFGRVNGRVRVIEYSEIGEKDMNARNRDGSLKYSAGSIAIHLLNVDFVERQVNSGLNLPYHVAYKKIPYLDESGNLIVPERPNGYKFEMFIFDILSDAKNPVIMEIERDREFGPVKNKEGENSPETARRKMCNLFGSWLEEAGVDVSRDEDGNVVGEIEISPLYASSSDELRMKLPRDFIFKTPLYLGP